MRILLVEDDLKIASFVQKGFRSAGFAVDHATDGENGLHLALTEPYDAAIIDVMLPGLDGLTLITRMRSAGINTPGDHPERQRRHRRPGSGPSDRQ